MHILMNRRLFISLAATLPAGATLASSDWPAVLAEARGQTVYFNAWAGSETINAYIGWVAGEVKSRHGITLNHVKVSDTAEVVRRVREEVAAGSARGSVDLVWINGENFDVMKREGLLFGPFARLLPNFRLVDVKGKPTTLIDFAEPTDGYESPWGMAQLTFFGDGMKVGMPPATMDELLAFARDHAGRVTYPAPPDFHGTTFLKQVLYETTGEQHLLQEPAATAMVAAATAPLFAVLDLLHPHLWRSGRQFPQSQAQLTQMLADGELLIGLTFNPNEPANLVASGVLPATTVAWQHRGGTIGNSHFVAIPANAGARAGAMVVANFLLSPEAQARKADLAIWGDPTVLAMAALSAAERALFPPEGGAPGALVKAEPALPEPHGSWVPFLEAAWLERYGT